MKIFLSLNTTLLRKIDSLNNSSLISSRNIILSPDQKEYHLLTKKAKSLSDLFALKEGRRPRVLIGGGQAIVQKKINVLANTFADLGCNVDIAPSQRILISQLRQSIENDVDIVLIIAHEKIKKSTIEKFQEVVFKQHQEIILSLYKNDSDSWPSDETDLHKWILLDKSSNRVSLALKLLNSLLQFSG